MAVDRRIILLAAVSAGDEEVAARIGKPQPVQAKSMLRLHQNNVSPAKARLGDGLHVNHFSIANGGSHAGSAGLEANANTGLQAL
jgi:hypothetical protein